MRVMDALDAAMITGEVLASPMHVGALLIFTPPADAGPHYTDDLHRQALLGGGEIDPRLRARPHIGLDTLGLWTWRDVEVDLPEHMQARVLPPGSTEHALWDLVADLHARPLDRDRPQWMAYLIDGLPGGRFAFYIKIHHTLVDGVEGMEMIAEGVETARHLALLRDLGCDEVQGYLYARPLPLAELLDWLASHRPAGA
mgnify:CR=1 FL=1